MNILPLTATELMAAAINRTPIPLDRAMATFADPENWRQAYNAEFSPLCQDKARPCEWCFVGPATPPYELAKLAMRGLEDGPPAVVVTERTAHTYDECAGEKPAEDDPNLTFVEEMARFSEEKDKPKQ